MIVNTQLKLTNYNILKSKIKNIDLNIYGRFE